MVAVTLENEHAAAKRAICHQNCLAARWVGVKEAAFDDVATGIENHAGGGAIDDQSAQGAARAATGNGEVGGAPRTVRAIHLDQHDRVVADRQGVGTGSRLGRAVNRDRIGDRRQVFGARQGVDTRARNVETDHIRNAAGVQGVGMRVGGDDRLTKRDRPVVGDRVTRPGHGDRREEHPLFQSLENKGPEPVVGTRAYSTD